MKTTTLLIIAGLILAGIFYEIVEVKFNTRQLQVVASRAVSLVSKPDFIDVQYARIIGYWRSIEYSLIKDSQSKMDKAFAYADGDIASLQAALEEKRPGQITAYTELLIKSLDRIRQQAASVPIEYLADIKEKSSLTFQSAATLIREAIAADSGLAYVEDELGTINEGLENELGPLQTSPGSQVAGATDEDASPSPAITPPTPSTIPLRF